MKEKLFGVGSVLGEMIIGIIFFALIVQVVGLFLPTDIVFYSIGLWIGAIAAIGMAFYMAYTIEREVEQGAGNSKSHVVHVLIRYLLTVILIFILFWLKIGNPFSCFTGVMGLKIGAYLQPLTHKLLRR